MFFHPSPQGLSSRPGRPLLLFTTSALATLAGSASAGVVSWLNPVDGFWDTGANWAGGAAPPSSSFAEIGLTGPFTVTIRTSPIVRGLLLSNPDAELHVENTRTISVAPQPGDTIVELVNNARILVNSNQGLSFSSIAIGSASVPGVLRAETDAAGEVILNLDASNPDLTDARLTIHNDGLHAANHTVRGKGQVTGLFTNEGLILADRVNDELRISAVVTQPPTGELGATAGGTLGLSGGLVRGGRITADEGARTALTAGSGTIEGGAVLSGRLDILNTFTLNIGPGGLVNDGEILVNSNEGTANTRVIVNADTTILGSGSFNLNVSDGNVDLLDAQLNTATGITATNGPDHTIRGKGQVLGSWVNEGIFLADRDAQELRIFGQVTQTPSGVVGAVGNAVLGIASGGRVSGGSVVTADAGIVEATSGTGIVDGALHNLGRMGVRNGATLQVAQGGIVNDAEIIVNTNQGTATTRVLVTTDAAILGAGSINLNVSDGNIDLTDAWLTTAAEVTATNGPDHTVRGKGQVSGDWVNQGLIRADRDGQELRITAQVAQSPTGVVGAVGNAVLGVASGGRVSGGSVVTADAGIVEATSGTGIVDGALHNLGRMGVRNGATLQVAQGGIVNDAEIIVNTNQGTATTRILVTTDAAILGAGSINLNVSDGNIDLTDAILTTAAEVTATNGPDHTVRGKGQLAGAWINLGTIDADRDGQDLQIIATVEQGDQGVIRASIGGFAVLQGAEISGGSFDAQSGAVHAAASSFVSGVTNLGALGVRNGGLLNLRAPGLTNHAVITINTSQGTATTSLLAAESATIDGEGEILLNVSATNVDFTDAQIGTTSADAVLTIAQGQTLTGKGRIIGKVVFEGTLAPGGPGAVSTILAATTVVDSAFTMTPSAVYDAELAGPAVFDRVTATTPVALDGTLRVTPIDEFEPAFPSSYTIATSTAGITGRFHTVEYQGVLPPGAVARALYSSTQAVFAITCPADFALPVGILDLSDISTFVAAFSAQDLAADLAPPFGLLDLNDIVAFVTSFGAGCP